MDDAQARQLLDKILAHPQVRELFNKEVISKAKDNRRELSDRIWKRAQRQLARQHGFKNTTELRQFLASCDHPFLEVTADAEEYADSG